jgi:L-asparagine transporter-like permease
MPGFPLVQGAGLLVLCAILVTMGLDKETWRISWIVGVPWIAFLSLGYAVVKARGRRRSGIGAAPLGTPSADV